MEARKMEANEMAMTQSNEHAAKEFNFTTGSSTISTVIKFIPIAESDLSIKRQKRIN